MLTPRIYLSPPHMSGKELPLVQQVFESNWIAPLGPEVDAFEREFAKAVGAKRALALSSGTAAIHLALQVVGVSRGDEVLVSTLTFSASVNPILYLGGYPTFIDSDRESWNMDSALLVATIEERARRGRLPKAVILVHLYGQSADIDPIKAACDRHGVALIEDAAEALGAEYKSRRPIAECGMRNAKSAAPGAPNAEFGMRNGDCKSTPGSSTGAADVNPDSSGPLAPIPHSAFRIPHSGSPGTFGRAGIYSFNGNKIITTAGGGMLVSDDEEFIRHARKLATQAREAFVHYEHTEIGYNYRMSNVLAAIGRGQLAVLEERVEARRKNFECYRGHLGDLPGIDFMPEAPWGRATRWLTCITIDPAAAGTDREKLRLALEAENIESRPVWKPMHLQPVFAKYECVVGNAECGMRNAGGTTRGVDDSVSAELFDKGLCLPSGTQLTEKDLARIVKIIRSTVQGRGH